jgi:hypothetical protein
MLIAPEIAAPSSISDRTAGCPSASLPCHGRENETASAGPLSAGDYPRCGLVVQGTLANAGPGEGAFSGSWGFGSRVTRRDRWRPSFLREGSIPISQDDECGISKYNNPMNAATRAPIWLSRSRRRLTDVQTPSADVTRATRALRCPVPARHRSDHHIQQLTVNLGVVVTSVRFADSGRRRLTPLRTESSPRAWCNSSARSLAAQAAVSSSTSLLTSSFLLSRSSPSPPVRSGSSECWLR